MKSIVRWRNVLYFVLSLLATVYAVGFSLTSFQIFEAYQLVRNGTKSTGLVFDKDRENHQRIRYRFTLDGKTYHSSGFSADTGKSFDEIQIGQSVPITYETGNPYNSTIGDSESTFYPNLRLAIFVSLFPTFALCVAWDC